MKQSPVRRALFSRASTTFDFARSARRVSFWIALAIACLASHSAFAQTQLQWTGTTTAWATAGNWNSGVGPAPTSDLVSDIASFDLTTYTAQPNAGTTSIAGILVGDNSTATGALTISTTALSIGASGITIDANAGTVTLNGAVNIDLGQSWANNSSSLFTVGATVTDGATNTPLTLTLSGSGSGGTTFNAVISNGAGTSTTGLLINTTGGVTTLNATNTFTGGIALNGGNLMALTAGSLGPATNTVTFGGGNLELRAAATTFTAAVNLNSANETITIDPASLGNGVTQIISGAATLGTETTTVSAGSLTSTNTNYGLTLSGAVSFGAASSNAAFTINGNGTGNGTLTLSGGFNTGGHSQTLTFNTGTGTGVDSAVISGAFAGTAGTLILAGNAPVTVNALTTTANAVQVNGSGAYTFAGANTFTGGVTLTSGTLEINSTTALGTAAGTFSINGGTIDTTNAIGAQANNNPISIGGNFAYGGTSNLNLGTGAITDAGNYTVTLNGSAKTLTFGGTLTNSVGGIQTTTVNGAGNTLSIGAYALSNSSTSYDDVINGNGNVTIAGVVSNGGSATASALTYSGTGDLTLSGANTFAGGLIIQSGTVIASTSANALGGTGTGTVTLGNTTGSAAASLLVSTSGLTYANPIVLATNASVGTLTIGNTGSAISTTFSGGVTGNNSFTINENGSTGTITFSTAALNNGGTITNIGAGTGTTTISSAIGSNVTNVIQNSATASLSLNAVNSFTGNLIIKQGTAFLTVAGAASSGAITLGDPSGGTARLYNNSTVTITNAINLAPGAVGSLSLWGPGGNNSGTAFSGPINLNGDNLTIGEDNGGNNGGGSLVISGGITGTGNLFFTPTAGNAEGITLSTNTVNNVGSITNNSPGTAAITISASIGANVTNVTENTTTSALVLSGVNTAFDGTVSLTAGSLTLSTATALGGNGSTIGAGGALSIADGTTLNSGVASLVLSTVNAENWNGSFYFGSSNALNTGTGAITVAAGGVEVVNNGANLLTIGGAVTGGNLSLVSSAAGGFTFTGAGGSINNTGSIANAAIGAGSTTLSGTIGSGVTSVVQNNVPGATATMTISGINTASAFTTTVTNGILKFGAANSLSGGSETTGSSTITVGSLGVLSAGYAIDQGFINTIAGGSGAVVLAVGSSSPLDFSVSANLANISLGASTNSTFSGTLNPNGTTYRLGGGGATLTVSAATLTGANSLVVGGPLNGTVVLSGTNSYTGTTTLNSGTLNAGVAENAGISGPFGAPSTPAGSIIFAGGTLQFSSVNTFDYSSRFATTANEPISIDTNAQTVTFASALTSSGGTLTKVGTGTLVLSNAGNTYSGGTTITAGTLQVTAPGDIGGGKITLNGGTLQIGGASTSFGTASNNFTISANSTIDTNSAGNSATFSGNLSGFGGADTLTLQGSGAGTFSGVIGDGPGFVGLTKAGTGTWILTSANTYSQGTTISGGSLQLNNSLAVQNSGVTISAANGLTFNSGLGSATVMGLAGASNETLQDGASSNGSAVTLNIGGYFGSFGTSPASFAYTGVLAGSGGVTKFGPTTQTFNQAETYTGTTTVNAGILTGLGASATATTPFGTGAIVINGGTLSLAPATASTVANWTGASAVSTAIPALTYGPGATLLLTRKDVNSGLVFTIGAAAGSETIARSGNGTLIVQTSTNDLGISSTSENLVFNGTAPTITSSNLGGSANGMVTPSIVSLGGASPSVGDFLTYGANGFTVTSGYTAHAASFAPTTNEIANITASIATTAAGNPLALRVGAFTLTIGTATSENLTVGTGSGQAGVILNGGTIAAFAGDVLAFGGAEGVVYSFNAASTISAPITGTGGLTIAGNKQLTLSSASNSFTGAINVNGAASLAISSAANLGNAANTLTLNAGAGIANSTAGGLLNIGRNITVNNGASITAGGAYDINFVGTGAVSIAASAVLLTGNNSFSDIELGNGSKLIVASDANLGGPSSQIRFSALGGMTFSVQGTQMTSWGTHSVNFDYTNNNGTLGTFEIQDPTNTFNWNKNDNYSMNSGNPNLTFTGQGTIDVTAPQTGWSDTGSSTAVTFNGGTLKIDEPAGGSIPNLGSNVAFGGGTFYLLGKTGSAVTQAMGTGVQLKAGGGTIIVDNNSGSSTTVLNLGVFNSFAAGSSLDIKTINAGTGFAAVTTPTVNDASGIIGVGRVVFGTGATAGFATITSGATIGAYTPGSNLPSSSSTPGTNYLVTNAGSGVVVSETANTLTVATSTTGQSLAITAGQTLTLASGGLLFTGANNYSITGGSINSNTATNSDLIIQQYGAGTLTLSSTVTNGIGTSTLTKAGPGTLILQAANTYTGATFVNGGVLSVDVVGELGATASAALTLDGGTLQASNSITTTHTVTLGGNGGTFDVANTKTLTLNGAISGAGLTVNDSDGGNGTVILGAGNSFASGIWIDSGVLELNNASALGANAAGTSTNGLNTLTFGSAATEKLELNGFAAYVAGLTDTSGNAVIENATSATPATLTVVNGGNNTFAGTIQNGAGGGAVSLVKDGGLTLTLTGANTYTGATTISNGTLQLGNGTSGHDGSIAGASIVDNAALAYDTNLTQSYSGVISGNGTVAKFGGGTLTLSGNNTYTGATTVTAGALLVSGSLSGSSAVTVGDPANLGTAAVLAGNGLVGNVTVGAASGNTGAEASPSDNVAEADGAGTTLSTGNFTIGAASGATLALQIGRTSPGSILAGDGSDHISSSGAVSLTGNLQLTIETGYTPAVNDVLYLIINDTSETGQFASVNGTSLGGGSTFVFDNFQWQISYTATPTAFTGGSDVAIEALSPIPEPGTWAMMLSGAGMLVGLQRLRRRRS